MFFFLLFLMIELKELRRSVRQRRRQLDPAQRDTAQRAMLEHLTALNVYQTAHRIAGYWSNDGELDIGAILTQAQAEGKTTYLPVMTGVGQPLLFAPYTPASPMQPNRYKIPEPVVPAEHIIQPHQLDLVLTPLVAFDDNGQRLGMGGGFYDRSFAFRKQDDLLPRPCLVGVAFELQHVPQSLPRRDWDVRLDAAVTEAGVYRWHLESV